MCVEVEAWTFEQHLGEAVFIPAGCPHQVRNMKVDFGLNCNFETFLEILIGKSLLGNLVIVSHNGCLHDAVLY
jgi:hypothetical protein